MLIDEAIRRNSWNVPRTAWPGYVVEDPETIASCPTCCAKKWVGMYPSSWIAIVMTKTPVELSATLANRERTGPGGGGGGMDVGAVPVTRNRFRDVGPASYSPVPTGPAPVG